MTGLLAVSGVILVIVASAYSGLTGSDSESLTTPGFNITPVTDIDRDADREDAQDNATDPEADATPVATEEPTPPPEPTQQVTNRQNCNQIRGTDYFSPEERTWFLANCVNR